MFTLLSRILSSLAASPTQLLMTRMTFLVGFLALPSAGVVVAGSAAGAAVGAAARVVSGAVASGSAGAVEAGLVACCSGSGSAGSSWYTTSFLGESSAGSFSSSVVSLPSWGWAESSSASLRVKAASGSGWLSPAASSSPAASGSCVSVRSLSGTATSALFPSIRVFSVRVALSSLVPSLITISSLVSV